MDIGAHHSASEFVNEIAPIIFRMSVSCFKEGRVPFRLAAERWQTANFVYCLFPYKVVQFARSYTRVIPESLETGRIMDEAWYAVAKGNSTSENIPVRAKGNSILRVTG